MCSRVCRHTTASASIGPNRSSNLSATQVSVRSQRASIRSGWTPGSMPTPAPIPASAIITRNSPLPHPISTTVPPARPWRSTQSAARSAGELLEVGRERLGLLVALGVFRQGRVECGVGDEPAARAERRAGATPWGRRARSASSSTSRQLLVGNPSWVWNRSSPDAPQAGHRASRGRPGHADDPRFGHRDDHLAAGGQIRRLLLDDLVGEVPGEEQEVVGPAFHQDGRVEDRLVGSRHVPPLLVGVAVDDEAPPVRCPGRRS